LTTVTAAGVYPELALLPLVSGSTFALFVSQLRGIAEHVARDASADARNVRSHASHWLDRIVLYDVNFNYHAEHHLHPEYPSCHLPAVQRALYPSRSVAPSMFCTIAAFLAAKRLRAHG
jgi:fatty acid desaturase